MSNQLIHFLAIKKPPMFWGLDVLPYYFFVPRSGKTYPFNTSRYKSRPRRRSAGVLQISGRRRRRIAARNQVVAGARGDRNRRHIIFLNQDIRNSERAPATACSIHTNLHWAQALVLKTHTANCTNKNTFLKELNTLIRIPHIHKISQGNCM